MDMFCTMNFFNYNMDQVVDEILRYEANCATYL